MSSKLAPFALIATVVGLVVYRKLSRRGSKKSSSAVQQIQSLGQLRNQYFAIRHGESEANVACVVSSDKVLARKQHGLTVKGREDARQGARAILSMLEPHQNRFLIVHSPFLRTKETAEEVSRVFGDRCVEVRQEDLLCERYFGVFEGKHSHDSYNQVWTQDEVNGCFVNDFGCESVYSVSERAAQLILNLEKEFKERIIVLVSHGDILQITRTTLNRAMDPKHHRRGEHLNPGQAIRLHLE